MSIRPDDPRLAGLPQEEIDAILRPYYQAEVDAAYASKTAAYGTGGTTVTPVTTTPDGRGQFTAEQAAAINDAADRAGGFFTGATQDYIDQLRAGALGGGTDTLNALNTLIAQGQAKPVTAVAPVDTAPVVLAAATNDNETATTILRKTLEFYGLDEPDLVDEIRTALASRLITGSSTIDEIGIQLRESPAFKRRFAANEARRAVGKPVYSVTQTLLLESQYRKNLRDSGMPPGFYDDPTSLQNFLINDISPDEILSRVTQGYQAVRNADPTVINELKTLYNLDDGSIAAFFVDPAKAQDNILRAARAAEIGAQARKQAGIGLTAQTAEELVRQGVTESEAQAGFTTYKQQESLYRPLMGEEELTQEEAIAGTLGTSAQAAQRVGTRKRRRKGTFEAGGKVSLQTIE
jgi:hypothetical protein